MLIFLLSEVGIVFKRGAMLISITNHMYRRSSHGAVLGVSPSSFVIWTVTRRVRAGSKGIRRSVWAGAKSCLVIPTPLVFIFSTTVFHWVVSVESIITQQGLYDLALFLGKFLIFTFQFFELFICVWYLKVLLSLLDLGLSFWGFNRHEDFHALLLA